MSSRTLFYVKSIKLSSKTYKSHFYVFFLLASQLLLLPVTGSFSLSQSHHWIVSFKKKKKSTAMPREEIQKKRERKSKGKKSYSNIF